MTHTETQAMCERLRELAQTTVRVSEWASRGHPETAIRIEDVLEWQAAAIITRQQETIASMEKERFEYQIQAGERADDVHRFSEAFYDLHAAALEAVICAEANCLTKDAPATARLRAALQAKP